MMRKLALVLVFVLSLVASAAALAEGFEGFDNVVVIGGGSLSNMAQEGLALTVGSAKVSDNYNGKSEACYAWITVDIHAVNWTKETVTLSNVITATLTHDDGFTFNGTAVFSREKLGMLEELDGQLVFKVPVLLALASPNALTLTTVSLGEESSDKRYAEPEPICRGTEPEAGYSL